MLTDQVAIVSNPSTSFERPRLRKGQIENQDQICEKRGLFIHGPENSVEKISVIRGPFNYGGCRCITVFKGGSQETINLADLSVVRYWNDTWNIDYWLGKF